MDVVKTADHIIDVGPEGGDGGGKIIATGTPEMIGNSKKSFTGHYLKAMLKTKKTVCNSDAYSIDAEIFPLHELLKFHSQFQLLLLDPQV